MAKGNIDKQDTIISLGMVACYYELRLHGILKYFHIMIACHSIATCIGSPTKVGIVKQLSIPRWRVFAPNAAVLVGLLVWCFVSQHGA